MWWWWWWRTCWLNFSEYSHEKWLEKKRKKKKIWLKRKKYRFFLMFWRQLYSCLMSETNLWLLYQGDSLHHQNFGMILDHPEESIKSFHWWHTSFIMIVIIIISWRQLIPIWRCNLLFCACRKQKFMSLSLSLSAKTFLDKHFYHH